MKNVPDYRGIFLRGLGGNSAALGELQSDAIRNITGNFVVIGGSIAYEGVFSQNRHSYSGTEWGDWGPTPYFLTSFDASRVVPTDKENRPINKAVRYFIKAK